MSWKGWVKMALHQPLVPVLPVARELISKTKWIASKGGHSLVEGNALPKPPRLKTITSAQPESARSSEEATDENPSPDTPQDPQPRTGMRWKKTSRRAPDAVFFTDKITAEPENYQSNTQIEPQGRHRVLSLFSRSSSRSGTSDTSLPYFTRKSSEASRR
ncbi:Protein SABRE [Paramarasmius palmivorus]|uniref:Protein SABRE n=1 Tax=Paramarasmius palmivorus TaxID=297713 RepID=A0AAW0EBH9_9AGAR